MQNQVCVELSVELCSEEKQMHSELTQLRTDGPQRTGKVSCRLGYKLGTDLGNGNRLVPNSLKHPTSVKPGFWTFPSFHFQVHIYE